MDENRETLSGPLVETSERFQSMYSKAGPLSPEECASGPVKNLLSTWFSEVAEQMVPDVEINDGTVLKLDDVERWAAGIDRAFHHVVMLPLIWAADVLGFELAESEINSSLNLPD